MRSRRVRGAVTFLGGFTAVGSIALLAKACPARCGDCSRCAVALGPLAASMATVGGALLVSAWAKRTGGEPGQ